MNKFVCGFCGLIWIPRVEKPKACPSCHRYFVGKHEDKLKKV